MPFARTAVPCVTYSHAQSYEPPGGPRFPARVNGVALWRVLASAVAVTLAAAEWLRAPTEWTAAAAVLAAAWASREAAGRRGLAGRAAAAVFVLLAVTFAITAWRQHRVEHRWTGVRRALVDRGFDPIERDLAAARLLAEQLAQRALASADLPAPAAFEALRRLRVPNAPEHGVVLLDPAGRPFAWAGAQRLQPEAGGPVLRVRTTPFVVMLEMRARDARGREAIGSVLLWAHPAAAGTEGSLAARFERREGLRLLFYAPGRAPASAEVVDWEEPTTAGTRRLLSARAVPPDQSELRQRVVTQGAAIATALLATGLVLLLAVTGDLWSRAAIVLAIAWLPLRSPIGALVGLEALFSPTRYFLAWGGPFTASAGSVLLTGALLLLAGLWVQDRRRQGGAARAVVAALAAAGVPSLQAALATGVTLPADGVPISLWLTWQGAVACGGAGLLVLLGGIGREGVALRRARWVWLGAALAVTASVGTVVLWQPDTPRAAWLGVVGAAAAVLAVQPTRRWPGLVAAAIVAAAPAAALVWVEVTQDRLRAAERDVRALRDPTDPLAITQLQTFADDLIGEPAPIGSAQLYAVWRTSSLRRQQRYPSQLALWSPDGTLKQLLALDSLDVAPADLGRLVRSLAPGELRAVAPLVRTPGTHHVLFVRLATGDVLSVLIGPRTRLIQPTRLGALLDPKDERLPPYELTLAPGGAGPPPRAEEQLDWLRDGWRVRARAPLRAGDRPRDVVATVDLQGPLPLALRGAAILGLDLLALLLLAFLADRLGGRPLAPVHLREAARAFRVRLGATLAGFVLVPIVAAAGWSFVRLGDEAARARELVLRVTLREAADAAPGSRTGEADPARYIDGVLDGASAPLLQELGMLDALLPPSVVSALMQRGERDASAVSGAAAVGYRRLTPDGSLVLAAPIPLVDAALARSQLDLILGVLVAALAGAMAALAGAAYASRLLSRPVAQLRRAALAIGRGSAVPPRDATMPLEFEPVFAAFEKMVEDLHAGRAAVETAQARLAATLATVATGVVALDADGAILVANPRAALLLGEALRPGQPLTGILAPTWHALADAVQRARLRPPAAPETSELAIGEQRILLTVSRLDGASPGLVLALNDVTDLSRAERVLAWGEMAQQVAHEIKNPLTPMRLGLQHLRRAWRDRRASFDATLEETSTRMLDEIDRLDAVARAFSRFAAPSPAPGPLAPIDVTAVARDVVQLYQLSGEGILVLLDAAGPLRAPARTDELKEVLLNLLENARHAGARTIRVEVGTTGFRVRDDGHGIPAALLPRVFEPRFSTNTSGSGLGLAIVRRLVEGWGGRIEMTSEEGAGTTVTVELATAPEPSAPSVMTL
jgi:signal transduction histidine kinase